jgi:DNA-binding NtrC family response regulator
MNKPHVLIVDDEENIRFTLSEALDSLPASIDSAANGQEALDKVEQQVYSIILLDLRMPGMDGMQVLERLRESRPEIPVVIITAHGTIESAVDAMKLGAIEFLQKPFPPSRCGSLSAAFSSEASCAKARPVNTPPTSSWQNVA